MGRPAPDIGFLTVVNPHRERVPLLTVKRGALVYREDRVTVARALRDDRLGSLHHHHQVTDSQYRAGRIWQALYEDSQVGRMGSSGDLHEPVDGSKRIVEPINDRQTKASKRIREIDGLLGPWAELVRLVLVENLDFSRVCRARTQDPNEGNRKYQGRCFRDALDIIAEATGCA